MRGVFRRYGTDRQTDGRMDAMPLHTRYLLDAASGNKISCFAYVVVQSADIYCAADQYYDAVEDRCVECSAICPPDVESDFCANNCPGPTS